MSVEASGVDTSYSKDFDPIIALPEVKLQSGEEAEELLFKAFSKVLRLDNTQSPPEWFCHLF
jgi:hypothetical protein